MKRTLLALLGIFLAAIRSIVSQKKQINAQRIIKQILEFRETNNKNISAFFMKFIWGRSRLNTTPFKMNHRLM